MKWRIEKKSAGWWPFLRMVSLSIFIDDLEYSLDIKTLQMAGKLALRRGETIVTIDDKNELKVGIVRNGVQIAKLTFKHWWSAEFDLSWNGNVYRVKSVPSFNEVFSSDLGGTWLSRTEAVVDEPLDNDIAAYLAYHLWRARTS